MPFDCENEACIAQIVNTREGFMQIVGRGIASLAGAVIPAEVGVTLAHSTHTIPDDGVSDTLVLAADAIGNRRIAWVQNTGNAPVYLSHTDPASIGNGILLAAGGIHIFGNGEWYTGQGLWAIQNSGGPIDLLLTVGTI